MLAGVLPTPAVALLALDLGAVISASHNPPEYNGVKLFDREGQKLTDAAEEEIEALFDAPFARHARARSTASASRRSYLDHIVERFGTDLSGLEDRGRLRQRRLLRDRADRLRAPRRRA